MTSNQIKRVTQDFTTMAKESVSVEVINQTVYAFGSELAVLRIASKYPKAVFEQKARSAYSENRKTWFFSLSI